MKIRLVILFILAVVIGAFSTVKAASDDSLTIRNLGHASVMLEYGGKVIHIDPRASEANYAALPDADIICITHDHGDHYDLSAINLIKKASTIMVWPQAVNDLNTYTGDNHIVANGDSLNLDGIAIEAIPAYNIKNLNNGQPYHPKGRGNGYIFTFNDLRVYLAGDTENIPEMDSLDVDIAFIPMNLPYTMTPEMAADAGKKLHPRILYIYHYGSSNTNTLKTLLADESFEIRIGTSTFVETTGETGSSSSLPVYQNGTSKIYPNPSRGLLTIELADDGAVLSVFDMGGKVRYQNIVLNEGVNKLDLQHLSTGNYLLELVSESNLPVRQLLTVVK
ncbi:MAG: MBL fold metallo-hydrolase [Prolixibacteraceae bacterium]